MYNTSAATIGNGAFVALAFNSERWDNDTIHSTTTATSRLTCRTAGVYSIFAHARFAANASGRREMKIQLNAGTNIATAAGAIRVVDNLADMVAATQYKLAVGDFVEVVVFQDSGGNLDIQSAGNYSPEFGMVRVSAG